MQSSQLYHYNGFCWNLDPYKSREKVKQCYNAIRQKYSIDENCVIVGGFSGGAIEALDLTFSNVISVKGFICVGPDTPKSFTKYNVQHAAKKNVKGVFMEGEVLVPEPSQEDMLKVFDEVGLKCDFYVNKGIGHAIPEDLGDKLSKALEFVLQ